MQTRPLGRSSLEVPILSFGAYAIGGGYWGPTQDELAVEAMRAAIDSGMNAIDTAPVYGFGHSERLVGELVRGRRDEVLIFSKCGIRWDGLRGGDGKDILGPGGVKSRVELDSRPESVRYEVEQSLLRMEIECMDLLQVHARDQLVPVAETMGALLDLRAEGKLREIGVSNYTRADLEAARIALGDVPLASDQPQYSLLCRDIEADILPWAQGHEVGLLVYSPIAQGLLTGKVSAERSFSQDEGRAKKLDFQAENRARVNAVIDEVLRPIAAERGATVAQVVLAWTIAQPGVTSALVGARTAEQVRENAAAAALSLSDEERALIALAFEGVKIDRGQGGFAARVRAKLKHLFGR